MNKFLQNVDTAASEASEDQDALQRVVITFRRDRETLRPRVNKPGSRLDREQRNLGEYFYTAIQGGDE